MANHSFRAKLWKYKGLGGWHFISLPKALSNKVRKQYGYSEEGWGRLKTTAKIGKSEWKTSVWYDTKSKGYLLPVFPSTGSNNIDFYIKEK